MKRTTVLVDEAVLQQLAARARQDGVPLSEIIRRALAAYAARPRRRRTLSLVGVGRSGRRDVAAQAEEILAKGFGR